MRRLPNYSDTSILGYDLLTLCYAIVFSVFFFFFLVTVSYLLY